MAESTGGEPHALIEQQGATLVVTMNRPAARNALTGEMLGLLAQAWDRVDNDSSIRSCVLTGAGGAFCAGADLKSMAKSDPGKAMSGGGWDPARIEGLLKGRRLSKPLIAAVEGAAIAGGTEILQGTDIRIAAESATFGLFEVRRGLFPIGGSTVRLQRQIPRTHALEMLLTGRPYTAAEAERIGLVGHVVPDGTALDRALALAEQINACGPLAVEAVKASVYETAEMTETDGLAAELERGWPLFDTADAKEGARAFAEKRPPVYRRA